MAKLTVTNELLTAALAGYQTELERIDVKMSEIRRVLGDRPNDGAAPSDNGRPRRRFSAATRKRMQAAQKRRWQKINEAEPPKAESAKPKKRKMSAAGRKAISEAAKRRWAAMKGESAVAKKPGRKKAAVTEAA